MWQLAPLSSIYKNVNCLKSFTTKRTSQNRGAGQMYEQNKIVKLIHSKINKWKYIKHPCRNILFAPQNSLIRIRCKGTIIIKQDKHTQSLLFLISSEVFKTTVFLRINTVSKSQGLRRLLWVQAGVGPFWPWCLAVSRISLCLCRGALRPAECLALCEEG